ncbi:response regulator [Glaciecola sp. XM2]|jgi:CheY-like chemotaxis protein|uniref:response regulator n=1 Tax=Glaciecola sp. XM2 TaxID=1914931 RepID=UPI001BDE7838|nr:response regulator [Glaciecola sp. XM2]MBT1449863.1 response regulator [Glaciecola sp. XM2]
MKLNEITGLNVLLIDDDDVDVIGMKRAFNRSSHLFKIFRARNGAEGLEMLKGKVQRPYIVVLDINMPKMNGLEMLDELRQDKALNDSIVFVMTTSKDEEDKMAAYEQHVAGYVAKSSSDPEFKGLMNLLNSYYEINEFPE